MKKYGFIKTFTAVCSGTSIFPEIVKFPFRRMLWHLFLLAVLGGIVNLLFRYHPIEVLYEETCNKLQNKFGNLKFSEKGIFPTKNPDQAGTVYMKGFRIDYFPEMASLKDFKPEDGYPYWIIWTPKSILLCIYYERELIPQQSLYQPEFEEKDKEKLELYVNFLFHNAFQTTPDHLKLYESLQLFQIPEKNLKPRDIPFSEIKMFYYSDSSVSIPNFYITNLFMEIIYNCMIAIPFYILIFSAFSFFLGKANILPMKFRELFVVGIYTGFPGIVIAILYTALELPYLNFQSVFLLGYLVYSFPVFARLRYAQIMKEDMNKHNNWDD